MIKYFTKESMPQLPSSPALQSLTPFPSLSPPIVSHEPFSDSNSNQLEGSSFMDESDNFVSH